MDIALPGKSKIPTQDKKLLFYLKGGVGGCMRAYDDSLPCTCVCVIEGQMRLSFLTVVTVIKGGVDTDEIKFWEHGLTKSYCGELGK